MEINGWLRNQSIFRNQDVIVLAKCLPRPPQVLLIGFWWAPVVAIRLVREGQEDFSFSAFPLLIVPDVRMDSPS